MKNDYSEKAVNLLNSLFELIVSNNGFNNSYIKNDTNETTIVQLGETVEEKLFLLNSLVSSNYENAKAAENLTDPDGLFNEFGKCIKNILSDIEPIYTIKISEIPGVALPCSNLRESKRIVADLNLKANIYQKNKIIC